MALSMIYGYEGNIHAYGQIVLQVGGASGEESHDNCVIRKMSHMIILL